MKLQFIIVGWHFDAFPEFIDQLIDLNTNNDVINIFWSCHKEPTDKVKNNFDYKVFPNLGLEDGLKKLGYKFVRSDVGDKYVSAMLSKKGWMLGGETSGHIICRDLVSTGDGTIAALKVISSLLLLEKKPSEVLANFKKIPQVNIAIKVKNKDIVNDKDLQSLIKEIESDITVGRVLVRPSGTEPKIRIMIEAPEIKVAKKYAADIEKLIESKS